MSPITDGWLESASGDLKNINYIIKDVDLTHIVAFHAQQCVEKSFKALLEHNLKHIPTKDKSLFQTLLK